MNILRFKRTSLAITIMCFFSHSISSREINNDKLHGNEASTVVSVNSDLLDKNYIATEASQKMTAFPENKLQHEEYSSLSNTQNLTQQLTKDLQSVSQNQHPKVYLYPTRIQKFRQQKLEVIELQQEKKDKLTLRSKNYVLKEALI